MSDLKPPPVISRVRITPGEVQELIEQDRIASLSLRIPTPCNLDCRGCYSSQKDFVSMKKDALTYEEIIDILAQSFDLGVRHVSFAGDGEPTMYKTAKGDIFSLIDYVNSHGAEALLFTNQTLITPKIAARLFERNLTVVGKQNTLDPEKQARYFCQTPNAQELLQNGLENLMKAGFNSTDPSRLAIHSVIHAANYEELPVMWRTWRSQNIMPYVQVMVPPFNPEEQKRFFEEDYVPPEKVRDLFERLLEIDEREFGYTWDVVGTYPIPTMGCSVALSGVGVTPTGDVQICSYTQGSLGNLKKGSMNLEEVLKSPAVRAIRRHKYAEMEKGNCYGCRCLVNSLGGDRFDPDDFFMGFQDQ
ncbi:MAG: radical SAM protein [archaeon]